MIAVDCTSSWLKDRDSLCLVPRSIRTTPARQSTEHVVVGESREEVHVVESTYMHDQYNATARTFDFHLLKLKSSSDSIPIKLNFRDDVPGWKGQQITIIGMGKLSFEGGELPSQLQQVNVDYVPNRECAYHVGLSVDYRDRIQENMICAEGGDHIDGYRGFCGGKFTRMAVASLLSSVEIYMLRHHLPTC
jgi:hypothetical protein